MEMVSYKGSDKRVTKYRKYSMSGTEPTHFYVFARGAKGERSMWSGWIVGDANLYYKLKKLDDTKPKLFDEEAKKLCTLVN